MDAGARFCDHIRNTERTTYFNYRSARNNHLAAFRQCVQGDKHCGRAVIDHGRGLASSYLREHRFHSLTAPSALAGRQVILEITIFSPDSFDRLESGAAQRGAAKIRVKHYARGIDDTLHLRLMPASKICVEPSFDFTGQ